MLLLKCFGSVLYGVYTRYSQLHVCCSVCCIIIEDATAEASAIASSRISTSFPKWSDDGKDMTAQIWWNDDGKDMIHGSASWLKHVSHHTTHSRRCSSSVCVSVSACVCVRVCVYTAIQHAFAEAPEVNWRRQRHDQRLSHLWPGQTANCATRLKTRLP